MTSYQNINRGTYGEDSREKRNENSLRERIIDICCYIVCFFELRAVKIFMGVFAAIGSTLAVYFITAGLLGGTLGLISAILIGICVVIAASFLFRHAE